MKMSGIGNIGSTPSLLTYLQKQSSDEEGVQELSTRPSIPTEAQREAHLDQALTSAGVDSETAASIKAELKTAFAEIQKSGQFPPDRETMKKTVDEIFTKYGLDAKTIFGRSNSGLMSADSTLGTSNEQAQTLLDLIETLAKQQSSPDDLAQFLSDALTGLDESV
jgi:hypothetical protein